MNRPFFIVHGLTAMKSVCGRPESATAKGGKKYLGSLRMRAGRVSSIEVNCVYTYYILPTYTVRTVPSLPLVSCRGR